MGAILAWAICGFVPSPAAEKQHLFFNDTEKHFSFRPSPLATSLLPQKFNVTLKMMETRGLFVIETDETPKAQIKKVHYLHKSCTINLDLQQQRTKCYQMCLPNEKIKGNSIFLNLHSWLAHWSISLTYIFHSLTSILKTHLISY